MQFGDPRAGNYVDFSYGSPHFNDTAFGYYTHLVGYIDVSINISANSYGSPDTGWDTSACLVYMSGAVDHSNYYGVTSSYGK